MEKQKVKDFSCGIIPLRRSLASPSVSSIHDLEVLILQHRSGNHWSMPKGHPEEGDNDQKGTAERELEEETGLKIAEYLLDHQHFDLHYEYETGRAHVMKTVRFFVAFVACDDWSLDLRIDRREILDHKWVPILSASSTFTFQGESEFFTTIVEQLRIHFHKE